MKYDVYIDGKFVGVLEAEDGKLALAEAFRKFNTDEAKVHLVCWG